MPEASPPRRGRALVRVLVIAAVASLHFATRQQASALRPLSERAFYAEDYEVALSLVAGRGFHGLDLDADQRPWAEAGRRFLGLKEGAIPRPAFEEMARSVRLRPASLLASTRVLEMYWAAAVWGLCGIRWSALFASYAALSSLVGLLLFLLGCRLGGGFLSGLLAAVVFLASPHEAMSCTSAIRDISPLWFDVLGFAALVGLVTPGAAALSLGVASFVVGVAATLGVGWRTDGYLLPVVLLLGLVLHLLESRRRLRVVVTSAALFLAGSVATGFGIAALGPDRVQEPQIGLHVAYYGGADRANLFGVENSFQTARDDGLTRLHAAYFAGHSLPYLSAEYAQACRRLYAATLRYGLFMWLRGLPSFLQSALSCFSTKDTVQGQEVGLLARSRIPWMVPAYRWLLDPLTRAGPYLFWLGVAALALRPRERVTHLLLPGFAFVYATVLLFVLPEAKHSGPLLLPLSVLSGIALSLPVTLASWRRERDGFADRDTGTRWRPVLVGVCAGALAWGLLLAGASELSRRERAAYLRAIRALPRREPLGTERTGGSRQFSVFLRPGPPADPVGYLLELEAGSGPSSLTARYWRGLEGDPTWGSVVTRHRLLPGSRQSFFLSCLQGMGYGDRRATACAIALEGDARLSSARRLDLTGWRFPLFSTLFQAEDRAAGPPALGEGVVSTEYETGSPAPDLIDPTAPTEEE